MLVVVVAGRNGGHLHRGLRGPFGGIGLIGFINLPGHQHYMKLHIHNGGIFFVYENKKVRASEQHTRYIADILGVKLDENDDYGVILLSGELWIFTVSTAKATKNIHPEYLEEICRLYWRYQFYE